MFSRTGLKVDRGMIGYNVPGIPPAELNRLDDTIYYNISIPYKENQTETRAEYLSQLNQPILYNPEEYFLAVVRFRVPGVNIPLMIARIQPFPNTNVNQTIYSVGLGYNGTFSDQIFVTYVPSDLSVPVPAAPTANKPSVDYTPYYYIYEYTNFLAMVNTALAAAYTNLDAKITLPGASEAPYFIYDPSLGRISLIAQQEFFDLSGVGAVPPGPALPITIYMNNALFQYFDGIPYFDLANPVAGRDIQFNVRNLNNSNWYFQPVDTSGGTPPYPASTLTEFISMTQEYDALADWNSLQTVQIRSNLLPMIREYLPQDFDQQNGVISSVGILSDFVPIVTKGPEFRSSIEYVANVWRLITLTGQNPITRLDLTFYWQDELGVSRIITIPRGESATAKLLFIKKSIGKLLAPEAFINK